MNQIEYSEEEERKKRKEVESGEFSPKNKKQKLLKLEEDILEWDEANLNELRTLLKDVIPLIRFDLIPRNDFHEKVKHFKKVIDKEFYQELLQYYDNNDKWQPRLLFQKGPRIRNGLISFKVKSLISNWINGKNNIYIPNDSACEFDLILRGSQDGFSRVVFEEKCYNIEQTVFIMRLEETKELIGSYNPI